MGFLWSAFVFLVTTLLLTTALPATPPATTPTQQFPVVVGQDLAPQFPVVVGQDLTPQSPAIVGDASGPIETVPEDMVATGGPMLTLFPPPDRPSLRPPINRPRGHAPVPPPFAPVKFDHHRPAREQLNIPPPRHEEPHEEHDWNGALPTTPPSLTEAAPVRLTEAAPVRTTSPPPVAIPAPPPT